MGADIVTWNLSDFPPRILEPLGLVALSPDDYLAVYVTSDADAIGRVMELQAADLRNPPATVQTLTERLERLGLANSVGAIRSNPPTIRS